MTKAAAADRRSNLSEGYRAIIGPLLTLSAIKEMFSANHTAKHSVVTDEETIAVETYGRSVISGHLEKNGETALKMMCCEIGRDGGKMVLPCRPKSPRRDKSFFQARFDAASIFVQAIRWTPT
jgi:hypothetical protein